MKHSKIRDTAVLVGLSPEGKCVYSELLPLGEYWDGDHVWDSGTKVKKIRLAKLKGLLFGSSGELLQEFESVFDLRTGIYKKGWRRDEEGLQED